VTARVYPAVPLPPGAGGGERADIVVSGLEQAGPSYELRVFLGNPAADAATELTPDAGYAGSIHVYGYGDPPPPGLDDARAPRLPMTRSLIATDPVRDAAARGPTAAITLVVVGYGPPDPGVDLAGVDVAVLTGGA
jgi:hypothetical protein